MFKSMQTTDRSPWRKFLLPDLNRAYLIRVLCVAGAAYLAFAYVLRPMRIEGDSMYPTYRDGQVNICFFWRYALDRPEAGDLVMVRLTGASVLLFKRVVASEGQTVAFRDGQLHVDGRPVEEPYASKPCDWNLPPREVKPGNVYVVGDNRSVPMETHDFGQTPVSRIVGGPLW
jgi:signal peptidase I